MTAQSIAHIGVLVADLDQSRLRWAQVFGSAFSPVTRYRCPEWCDFGNPEPHLHDARLTFYLGDYPSIEMLEFVGNGTHAASRGEGGHHVALPPILDNDVRRSELAELGVGIDGDNRQDGRSILMFSDARATNNVYVEWVEDGHDHPDCKDDGSPVNRLPDGSKTLFDVSTILELNGQRPLSNIAEIGVTVVNLDKAIDAWRAVVGYSFETTELAALPVPGPSPTGSLSAVSIGTSPRLRLVKGDDRSCREGLNYAIVKVSDLDAVWRRLRSEEVPLAGEGRNLQGELICVDVDPGYLNNFSVRFSA